ncbi:hypothetical protein PYCCODRAFT_1443739 [Trametes coccinea BRFM310]|uniref:RRM domain-containing protein n=1 Tax=Trametes coccinea (strain BRFM310) TaxID=1353009 RepID=A0A1Y2ITK8_TRAC3|nr:hypothetical protein PYCCODRAFT_1443739 [Trametes coccinea BRFM310]
MQSHLGTSRSDSPNNLGVPNQYKPAQHNTDIFQGSQNNTNHTMYNSLSSIGLPSSDYSSLPPNEPDALNFAKVNGSFAAAPFKTSTSFTPFATRSRHPPSLRDTSSFPYPPSNDLFGGVQNPISHLAPSQSQPALPNHLDSLHTAGRPYDLSTSGSQLNGGMGVNGVSQKQLPFGSDHYRQGYDSTPTLLQQKQPGGVSGSQALHQNGQSLLLHPSNAQTTFHNTFPGGLGSHPLGGPLPQSSFGSHLAGNGLGPGQSGGQGSGVSGGPPPGHANGPVSTSQAQEEISTIFVVGFPDDMSEREFQNMFTFSSGFEAATLKIPNKESTSYANNAQNGRAPGLQMPFGGTNDPYNVVTMNQGGVLVDGGRDGPMTSWPAPGHNEDGHFVQSNMPMQPPRKQIIGFAKFRTRADALQARDVLQGRRVDVEKGAVLKAEMAKKNLHTKRGPGVGPSGLPSFPGNASGAGASDNIPGMQGLPSAGEALTQRDKQLGAMGAMGVDMNGFAHRRDRLFDGREEDDRERRRDFGPMGMGGFGTRGPRERAEEDERERERKRREKEKEAARLRQNSFAFEAFHSVPQQMVRQGANSLLSAESGMGLTPDSMSGPWGNLRDVSASAALRKMGLPQHHLSGLPARPQSPSSLQTSPPAQEALANLSVPVSASSQNGGSASGSRSAQFSPDSNPSALPMHPSLPTRPRAQSPSSEPQQQSLVGSIGQMSASLPNSTASSVSGSQSGHEDELVKSVGALALSTESGSTSPQLPSPASGTSSHGGRNGSDQNPPINTLYVGNLPTSTSPGGYTLSFLEDRLRDLFSKQPGYRKLCFRQKSNGPMCFVEFESVEYATKALNDLYGDSLNGLVRNGGIRLSYSKNPLGVRTPNSGGNGPSLQQQQQQQQQHVREPLQEVNRDFGELFPRYTDSVDTIRAVRRDTAGMTSPTSSYHYTTSPPPPRFFSPPPPSGSFNTAFATSSAFPRANPQGYGLGSGSSSAFSPFGIPTSTIPDQPSADANSNDHIAHSITPPAANVEASRAG